MLNLRVIEKSFECKIEQIPAAITRMQKKGYELVSITNPNTTYFLFFIKTKHLKK